MDVIFLLFLDLFECPVMVTAVETVAPTFTCCPLEKRCISSPQWSSCSMWMSSYRDTTLDTQMTSNGEQHSKIHTHTLTRGAASIISCSPYHICHLPFICYSCSTKAAEFFDSMFSFLDKLTSSKCTNKQTKVVGQHMTCCVCMHAFVRTCIGMFAG